MLILVSSCSISSSLKNGLSMPSESGQVSILCYGSGKCLLNLI